MERGIKKAEFDKLNSRITSLMTKVSDQKLIIRRKLNVPFGKCLTFYNLVDQPVTSIILTLTSLESLNKLLDYYQKVIVNRIEKMTNSSSVELIALSIQKRS
jgi:hypothetical protein